MRYAYVIGSPIGHSISPEIHNAAFAACGIDARYEAVDVSPAGLGDWVAGARRADLMGFSVTIPHKEQIVPHLDEVEGDARAIGAVSAVTVSASGGNRGGNAFALIGKSTDAPGFRRSLREEAGMSLRGQRVLLLGAGGAARAIALVAIQDGAEQLWVANRHEKRAQQLLDDLAPLGLQVTCEALAIEGPRVSELLAQTTVVVNATSVGLRSEQLPLDPGPIQAGTLVVDAVYNPAETAFLRAAREQGARVLGGLGMLVYQAAVAFEDWNGVPAPIDAMREAADRALGLRE